MTPTPGHARDMLGRVVRPGDHIVAATARFSCPSLRVGQVEAITERPSGVAMKVRWAAASRDYAPAPGSVSFIEVGPGRFLRLDDPPVTPPDPPGPVPPAQLADQDPLF